uniref:Uncharacterized protein n=1 Tax=Anguilla anguilla TaxID=7936 RepID=A0A0E9R5J3_ANGAN
MAKLRNYKKGRADFLALCLTSPIEKMETFGIRLCMLFQRDIHPPSGHTERLHTGQN